MVTAEYRPREGPEAGLQDARFSRRRTDASARRVWPDGAEPGRILEQFVVASWEEHLRLTHWLTPPVPRQPGG